jgi:hypothetical protein
MLFYKLRYQNNISGTKKTFYASCSSVVNCPVARLSSSSIYTTDR